MNKLFYPKLACDNIRKNKSIYFPYLLASAMMAALCYILSSVTIMCMESGAKGGDTMAYMLSMSTGISAVFSVVILFYVNSFVMKQRKRELGLYCILGMERRHLSLMMVWEVAVSFGLTMLAGILFGCLSSQMMFLLLLKMVGIPARLTFRIPFSSILDTGKVFLIGFALILIYDIWVIYHTNPIALLSGSNKGEREPKARWLLALAGMAALMGGYVMAIASRTPGETLQVFFPAVLLVIIGTYGLFIAGSIALLKLMKANRHIYYKPENFITISGMMYRMKQNAAGLAGICILSTAVLLIAASCTSLVIGEEDVLRKIFFRDGSAIWTMGEESLDTVRDVVREQAVRHGVQVADEAYYLETAYAAQRFDRHFSFGRERKGDVTAIVCLTQEDYNRVTGGDLALAPGQAAVWSTFGLTEGEITLEDYAYEITARIERPEMFQAGMSVADNMVLVLPSMEDMERLNQKSEEIEPEFEKYIMSYYWYDLQGEETMVSTCFSAVETAAASLHGVRTDDIEQVREEFYQIYGSIFFVGVFMVLQFMIVTVMIIYYKQITEGYDDHDRFRIMKQVGMSDREVKRTIRQQIRQVFFLPLLTAYVHIMAAFPAMCRILSVFGMNNVRLFAFCTAGAALLFAVFYLTVYRLTARTYFELVRA